MRDTGPAADTSHTESWLIAFTYRDGVIGPAVTALELLIDCGLVVSEPKTGAIIWALLSNDFKQA